MADRDLIAFTTKKEYAAQLLRELVISGELRSGARVMQPDIAEELGVSVTPVREAIRQLETGGYLESTAWPTLRGVCVRSSGVRPRAGDRSRFSWIGSWVIG